MNSIELLVQLASLQTAFLTLDEAIKTTNRRVNALDNVVRPKLENTISYIKVCMRTWSLSIAASIQKICIYSVHSYEGRMCVPSFTVWHAVVQRDFIVPLCGAYA